MLTTRFIHCILGIGIGSLTIAQITVGTIPAPGILCANAQIELPYTAVGTFNVGNTFTAELSDVTGSFVAPTVIGSVLSSNSGTVTCVLPVGLAGNGFQLRVNSSDPSDIGVPTVGLLMEAPNAGSDGFGSSCGGNANAAPFLGGTPEMGGTWSIIAGIGVWAFDDYFAGMANGEVVGYTVTSPGGCVATSTITFNVMPPPVAGTNASVVFCSSDPPVSMLTLLGGSPNSGGSWTGPAGNLMSGVFIPGVDVPGCYTYTVAGSMPCPNASSTLCITVNPATSLGPNFSLNVCGGPPIDMGAGLPLGGTWTYLGQPHSNIFTPGVDAPGQYVYTMPGVAPCPGASLIVMMNVVPPPNAGVGGSINRCLSQGNVDLFSQLSGTPDVGGTWTDVNGTGQLTAGVFVVAGMPNGTYAFTYTVPGSGACLDEQATVIINLSVACMTPPQSGLFTQ